MRTPAQIMADVKAQHAQDNPPAPPMPDPEVYATLTEDIPRGAKAIAKLCERWEATYARGSVATTGASKWRTAGSWMLKGERGQRRFVAVWIEKPDGSIGYETGYAHGIGRVNATQLKDYLTLDIVDMPWLEQVGYLSITRKGDIPL